MLRILQGLLTSTSENNSGFKLANDTSTAIKRIKSIRIPFLLPAWIRPILSCPYHGYWYGYPSPSPHPSVNPLTYWCASPICELLPIVYDSFCRPIRRPILSCPYHGYWYGYPSPSPHPSVNPLTYWCASPICELLPIVYDSFCRPIRRPILSCPYHGYWYGYPSPSPHPSVNPLTYWCASPICELLPIVYDSFCRPIRRPILSCPYHGYWYGYPSPSPHPSVNPLTYWCASPICELLPIVYDSFCRPIRRPILSCPYQSVL